MKNLKIRFLRFLRLTRNQHRNQMENEYQEKFIDQRLYYKCKVNIRIHTLYKKCSRSKWKRDDSLDKERCISIYTRKKLGLHSKICLIYCLMGLERGCKSTPTVSPPRS